MSEKFLLHIYTHGTREYAEACAKVMDPDDKLFRRRIISRTDVPELGSVKSLKTAFPMDDKMVVILDDNANVWRGCRNLITVKPFYFFKGMAGVNKIGNETTEAAASSSSTSSSASGSTRAQVKGAMGSTTARVDPGLLKIGDLLKWTHTKFYARVNSDDAEVDVKEILDNLKRRILRGVWAYIDDSALDVAHVHLYTKKLIQMELASSLK